MGKWYFETLNGRFDMSQGKNIPVGAGAALGSAAKKYQEPRQEKREVVELDSTTMVRTIVSEPIRHSEQAGLALQCIVVDSEHQSCAATLYTRETLEKLREVIDQTLETADAFETQAALDDEHLESYSNEIQGEGSGG